MACLLSVIEHLSLINRVMPNQEQTQYMFYFCPILQNQVSHFLCEDVRLTLSVFKHEWMIFYYKL